MENIRNTGDGRNPTNQLSLVLSHYLQGFLHPRWLARFLPSTVFLRVSPLNSLTCACPKELCLSWKWSYRKWAVWGNRRNHHFPFFSRKMIRSTQFLKERLSVAVMISASWLFFKNNSSRINITSSRWWIVHVEGQLFNFSCWASCEKTLRFLTKNFPSLNYPFGEIKVDANVW